MALVPFQQTPNSSLPSSSLHPPQWTFNVFLSFRGEDIRNNFLSHLYNELYRRGIRTFRDDKDLQRGEEISPELLKAIDESQFSIVVISKNYASSRWCLDELVRILECKNQKGQTVYPVFLRVDPSNVRRQTGDFGEEFDKLLVSKSEIAKVQSWREALNKVGSLSGWAFPNPNSTIGSESELIQELVGKIFYKLHHKYSSVDERLVGMNSRMEKMIELLDLGNDDCRVVGIWGMSGMGKTTIARVVYNHISWQFDGCSFVENVRDVSRKCGVTFLQQQLISDIIKESDFKVRSIDNGKSMIERIVRSKKVLIVLDDVDESIEIENLLGEYDWFSFGSKVIITTRDPHVFSTCDLLHTYKVDELKKDEAVELLKLKAFSKNKQRGGYGNLLDRAAEYCEGVPLALKVLGSFLHGQKEIHWEIALTSLEKSSRCKVDEVFRISFDALGMEEKNIFLDIACFYRGKDKIDVTRKLECSGFNPILGMNSLVEKSLITISYNRVEMHDLIQELGHRIVRQESPNEPGKRSRLWLYEDISHVLTYNMGTNHVEGIVVEHQHPKDSLQLNSKAFKKLTNLRILEICCFHLKSPY